MEIQAPARLAGVGHLIDHIAFAQRPNGRYVTAPNPLGGERKLWKVELGKALCALIGRDLWQRRDPQPIAGLRHGISQAVVRHVLSHKVASCDNWSIDTLIHAVAGELNWDTLRDRRRELREDAAALADLGVSVEQYRGAFRYFRLFRSLMAGSFRSRRQAKARAEGGPPSKTERSCEGLYPSAIL